MATVQEVVTADIPAALTLLQDITKASGECLANLKVLHKRVKDNAATDAKGLSFLSVKNSVMLQYVADLAVTCDLKVTGGSVQHSPAVHRLLEGRTVLEKMRPIEHKLRYQINKVVTAFKEGKVDPSDPRKFKANFGSFTNMDGHSSEEEADKDKPSEGKPKLYVAPKLAPVYYSDDETPEERHSKQQAKASRKQLSQAMLREVREQYTDAPVEISESNVHRMKRNTRDLEKTEYEESNFVRLQVSRKERMAQKRVGTMGSLGTLAEFDNFSPLDGTSDGGPVKKKKKLGGKKSGKSYGKKKGGKKFRKK